MKVRLNPIDVELEFQMSRETTKSIKTVVDQIPYVLARLDYEVLPNSNSRIFFKYGWWNTSRAKRLFKIETGNFEIVTSNDKTSVKLIYHSSILGEIIILLLTFMFCFISFMPLFINILFAAQLYFRLISQKHECELILDEIVKETDTIIFNN